MRTTTGLKDSGHVTADEIMNFLHECLDPDFGHMLLRIRRTTLGNSDGIHVLYNSVPQGTRGVDVDNAFATPKFSIEAAPGLRWKTNEPAPEKLKVEMFSGAIYLDKEPKFGSGQKLSTMKFRAKTGTPEQVVEYLCRFFVENKGALLP